MQIHKKRRDKWNWHALKAFISLDFPFLKHVMFCDHIFQVLIAAFTNFSLEQSDYQLKTVTFQATTEGNIQRTYQQPNPKSFWSAKILDNLSAKLGEYGKTLFISWVVYLICDVMVREILRLSCIVVFNPTLL